MIHEQTTLAVIDTNQGCSHVDLVALAVLPLVESNVACAACITNLILAFSGFLSGNNHIFLTSVCGSATSHVVVCTPKFQLHNYCYECSPSPTHRLWTSSGNEYTQESMIHSLSGTTCLSFEWPKPGSRSQPRPRSATR